MWVLWVLAVVVSGWWDEGHMLIASVARQWLTAPADPARVPWTAAQGGRAVAVFDRVFRSWQADFPDYTNLVSTAVWADHIKCRYQSDFCGTRRDKFDGIQIFNDNHFVDIYYNTSMDATERKRHYVAAMQRKDNAGFLLKTIHTSLMDRYAGSMFSINLLLRLFIHVLGDVHQPLHTMTYISEAHFPATDRGGNQITVTYDGTTDETAAMPVTSSSLHALWDSGGWQYTRNYPNFSVEESNSIAADIIERHPNVSYRSFDQAIEDSYNYAPIVYDYLIHRLNGSHSPAHTHATIRIGKPYLDVVREISEKRVAQAGFALAHYLFAFVQHINADRQGDPPGANDPPAATSGSGVWWKIYSAMVTCLLSLMCVLYTRQKRQADTFFYIDCEDDLSKRLLPPESYRSSSPSHQTNPIDRKWRRPKGENLSLATSDNGSSQPPLTESDELDHKVVVGESQVIVMPSPVCTHHR